MKPIILGQKLSEIWSIQQNVIILSRISVKPNVIHENTWKEQEKAVLEALENKISSMEKYIQASWDTTQRNYKLTSENKSIFNKLQGIFLNKINKIFFLNTVILYLRLCYGRTWTVSVLLGSNTSSSVYSKLFYQKKSNMEQWWNFSPIVNIL